MFCAYVCIKPAGKVAINALRDQRTKILVNDKRVTDSFWVTINGKTEVTFGSRVNDQQTLLLWLTVLNYGKRPPMLDNGPHLSCGT